MRAQKIRLFVIVLGLLISCKEEKKMNHLKNEKSPYLLQHADNPVDWYPWSEEAFEKARKEDKPIFLSIGYSTCHWCHVMEHESFEDPEVAALLNQGFISVKVDREERPDIDAFYMQICQMLTGSGGWPLTIMMSPDKKAFFAGTYFPKNSMPGRIGLMELLPKAMDLWKNKRQELFDTAENIMAEFEHKPKAASDVSGFFKNAFHHLEGRFDEKNGGFGHAPKFPSPQNIWFLFRAEHSLPQKAQIARKMATQTLDAMRAGGIYDQIGFGFHRYATDYAWKIPHFEKMLYDEAMLMMAYTEGFRVTKDNDYKRVVLEIFEYLQERMLSPDGTFYSAEDADSDKVEGKFYTFTYRELEHLLEKEEFTDILHWFGIERKGNFTDEEGMPRNIFWLKYPLKEFFASDYFKTKWPKTRSKIKEYRDRRVRPFRDDKILTDWNGLMIAGLSYAGYFLNESLFTETAGKATRWLLDNMEEDGRLLHRFRDGEKGIAGQLSDYAYLIFGLLHLYRAEPRAEYLEAAIRLQRTLDIDFADEAGGYFLSAASETATPTRVKEAYDGAIPSANSICLWNLNRLYHITGDKKFRESAEKLLKAFSHEIQAAPGGYSMMVFAADSLQNPAADIVIVVPKQENNPFEDILREASPEISVSYIYENQPEAAASIRKLAPFTKSMKSIQDKPTAYLCHGFVCERPTTDPAELKAKLQ